MRSVKVAKASAIQSEHKDKLRATAADSLPVALRLEQHTLEFETNRARREHLRLFHIRFGPNVPLLTVGLLRCWCVKLLPLTSELESFMLRHCIQ